MTNIEFRYEINPQFKDENTISAYQKGKEVGYLDFKIDDNNPEGFEIEWIQAFVEHIGVARALFAEFIRLVGHDVPVVGYIIHDETFEYFKQSGIFDQLRQTSERDPQFAIYHVLEITDPEVLDTIPIVRVRKAGGITTTKIKLSFDPRINLEEEEEDAYVIVAYGVTV